MAGDTHAPVQSPEKKIMYLIIKSDKTRYWTQQVKYGQNGNVDFETVSKLGKAFKHSVNKNAVDEVVDVGDLDEVLDKNVAVE